MASASQDSAQGDQLVRTVRGTPSHAIATGRWLIGLFLLALFIRLTLLTSKSAWLDESSTLIFSLGNYSRMIATDQVISLAEMVRPLQFSPEATTWDAGRYLLAENNHPPAYFMLAHLWLDFFHWVTGQAQEGADVSLWASRALPAFFGALAVPLTYWLGWLSFRDRIAALLCAAVMAVSPFSVFLSQEARHYTLAILFVIASLCCFVQAVRAVREKRSIAWLTVALWIVINGIGIAVHYFCGLTYLSEGLVLLGILIAQWRQDKAVWRRGYWGRIYLAAVGTAVGGAVWLPVLLHFYGSPQTTYLTSNVTPWAFWIRPIAQAIVGWLIAFMSPATGGFSAIALPLIIISCVVLLFGYLPWFSVNWVRAIRHQWQQQTLRSGLIALGGFFMAGNAVFWLISYGTGFDITRGHRYSFVFYPSIIMLVGIGLAAFWQQKTVASEREDESENIFDTTVGIPFTQRRISGRQFVLTVLAVGFLGTQAIVFNYSHLKFYHANRFVNEMQAQSANPAVVTIATVVGDQPSVLSIELFSVALEVQRQMVLGKDDGTDWAAGEPSFIMLERNVVTDSDPVEKLEEIVTDDIPRPFDLWSLNIAPNLEDEGCSIPEIGNKGSYRYHHYVCS